MFEIIHRVGIQAQAEKVYQALTTNEGLMQWWTNDITGAGEVGSTIKFRFNGGGPDFQVSELIENKVVRWKHYGNVPEAWGGTEVLFELTVEDNQTFVNFSHSKWQSSNDFMAHCNTKWAVFLISLKEALEKGEGRPFPNDIQIDHS